jgi:hypothetical protein
MTSTSNVNIDEAFIRNIIDEINIACINDIENIYDNLMGKKPDDYDGSSSSSRGIIRYIRRGMEINLLIRNLHDEPQRTSIWRYFLVIYIGNIFRFKNFMSTYYKFRITCVKKLREFKKEIQKEYIKEIPFLKEIENIYVDYLYKKYCNNKIFNQLVIRKNRVKKINKSKCGGFYKN